MIIHRLLILLMRYDEVIHTNINNSKGRQTLVCIYPATELYSAQFERL